MKSASTNKGMRWVTALVAAAMVLALMIAGDQPSANAIDPGQTDVVYVADGYNFPDALMGATLAALNNAPMLGVLGPTSGDAVPDRTAAELDRLTNDKTNKLDTIYIFGGPAAVTDKVLNELTAWANDVQRISGNDRFGTMQAISKMLPTKAKDADLLDGMDSTDFLGKTEQAADSDKLDGKDSAAFMPAGDIVITQQLDWWVRDGDAGSVTRSVSHTELQSASTDDRFTAELMTPTVVGGVDYGLKSVEICYRAATGFGQRIDTTVVLRRSDGEFASISDANDRTGGLACYVIDWAAANFSPPPAPPVHLLELQVDGTVKIFRVSSTFTPM